MNKTNVDNAILILKRESNYTDQLKNTKTKIEAIENLLADLPLSEQIEILQLLFGDAPNSLLGFNPFNKLKKKQVLLLRNEFF